MRSRAPRVAPPPVNEFGSMPIACTRTLPHAIARQASGRDLFAGVRQSQETLKRMDVTRP